MRAPFSLLYVSLLTGSSSSALRLTLFVGRGQRNGADVNRAGTGGRAVGDRSGDVRAGDGDRRAGDTGRRRVHRGRQRRGIRGVVGEIRFLRRDQVAKIGLHRREIRLFLRVGELRNRDGG